jgi:hypothetical protein
MDPLYCFGLGSAFVVPYSFLLQQVHVMGLSDIIWLASWLHNEQTFSLPLSGITRTLLLFE